MDGTTVCKPILNQKKEKYYGKCKEETTEYYQKNKEQKRELEEVIIKIFPKKKKK